MKRVFWLVFIFVCLFTTVSQAKPVKSFVIHYEPSYRNVFSDIPLSNELISHMQCECDIFGIDFYVLLGLIHVETGGTFRSDLISDTNDYGLCQINKTYESYHCELVGIDPQTFDAFNPYNSVSLAVRLLARLQEKYSLRHEGKDLAMMYLGAYNRGESGMEARSNIETSYAKKVLEMAEYYSQK